VVRKQVSRSVTSLAANYRAMTRACSEKERFAKLSIAIEETDETLFWLDLIEDLSFFIVAKLEEQKNKTEEIVKALSVYRKK